MTRKIRIASIAFVMILVVGLMGCGQVLKQQNPINPVNIKINIMPETPSIMKGATQQFSAIEVNSGSQIPSSSITWEVQGVIGTIDANGLFFANTVGIGTIEAKYNNIIGSSTVEVTPRIISGYVYDLNKSNMYTKEFVPIQGANVYVEDKVATTDANGSFSISDVPVGENTISTIKGGHSAYVLVTDKENVKLFLGDNNYSYLDNKAGSSTISGQISGMDNIYDPHGYVHSYDTGKTSYNLNYTSPTKKYVITDAPDNGETYAYISCETQEGLSYNYCFAYDRVNMSPGSAEVNLEFGDNSINCTIANVPIGFKTNGLGVGLCLKGKRLVSTSSDYNLEGKTSCALHKLPDLKSEDKYALLLSLGVEGNIYESWYKYVYCEYGAVNIDASKAQRLRLKDPTPATGATIEVNPTFSWSTASMDNVIYEVEIWGNDNSMILMFTKGNSITIPNTIKLKPGVNYTLFVMAVSAQGFEIEDYSSAVDALFDQFIFVVREFYVGGEYSNSLTIKNIEHHNDEGYFKGNILDDILGIHKLQKLRRQ